MDNETEKLKEEIAQLRAENLRWVENFCGEDAGGDASGRSFDHAWRYWNNLRVELREANMRVCRLEAELAVARTAVHGLARDLHECRHGQRQTTATTGGSAVSPPGEMVEVTLSGPVAEDFMAHHRDQYAAFTSRYGEECRKFWRDVAVAVAGAANSDLPESPANWADYTLKIYKARFPVPVEKGGAS